jgi:hypothetical protein
MFRATIIPRLQESLASSALGDCSFLELTIFIISLAITLGSSRAVYLVYFHPLASFPGPYKAIFSSWWQYPLSKHGKIEEVLEHLHRTYSMLYHGFFE